MMNLRVVGAGLPRTGTESLRRALERLLGGRCYHMSAIPGHPFNLGSEWESALRGGVPDWDLLLREYLAAVDWPASMFWRELSERNPEAIVLLSVRSSAEEWYQSADPTILDAARNPQPENLKRNDLAMLLRLFTRNHVWDEKARLMEAYDRHNSTVRDAVPPERLLEWQPSEGWDPICRALELPVPDEPFPFLNRREDWG